MAQGPASVYIKDAKFMLTVDPQRRLLDDTSLAVSGDRIAAIGPNAALEKEWVGPDTKVIDGRERFVTPGLINSHIHLESCYDKGLIDDVPVVSVVRALFLVHLRNAHRRELLLRGTRLAVGVSEDRYDHRV